MDDGVVVVVGGNRALATSSESNSEAPSAHPVVVDVECDDVEVVEITDADFINLSLGF